MFKGGGGYFLEGVDYRSVAYGGEEGGIFWLGGIDSGSAAYSCKKEGYILEGRGRFWERHCI